MFGEFLKRLTAPAPAPLTDTDARLALGALLVRVARSDNNYDAREVAKIDQILSNRYDLTEAEARELRKQCEVLETEAPDTVRFTRAIKDAVPHENRVAVVESLWEVALTDGMRDENEDAVLRLVSDLLGVNDMDRAKARQRVDNR
ncbi:tellurite resistance TerB family protein [Profundibacter amoris]|uniref:TerB family tellurite resistance protein n=1 Tax=Profundibacter amoris TaxID=2171755 RepID=A0A347UE57_9RHOB|nr:TerB family tellurite resistance protein [Profundibacter amoris]AXX97135.1 TerB family tellurite resistance protein [Profundibacter amoris]